ncbi:DsbA family protein [Leifsonia sp. Root112D2]|uniref:DsbA family protein n=1 Tax=Leifsonia sp. Root112D2 TaxID=1736426 RepID=UPI0006FF5B8C|nr:thioredoxin domain-containing protein [Leifsonia sp. Root112D2]KQV08046.1 hypothetical protein ASC63_12915 [Leifsonia sp. Root112D2]
MRIGARLAAILLAGVVVSSLAACAPQGDSASNPKSPAPVATGTVGAAHLDDGYLVAGTGAKAVDMYFDAMCPVCNVFEQTNGQKIADAVNAGDVTLRLHPMTFLDRGSQGTEYSTRAAAALTCVAAQEPRSILAYLQELYANQPQENSKGLDDSELISLASKANAPDITSCVNAGTYRSWAQSVNEKALAGPVKGTPNNKIEGTPTVLVNGHMFDGHVDDAPAFNTFFAAN